MKRVIAALKSSQVFGVLSEAFVLAAAANARIVEVGAGALIMKVPPLTLQDVVYCASSRLLQAGQVDLSIDSDYSPVNMNERASACIPSNVQPILGTNTLFQMTSRPPQLRMATRSGLAKRAEMR
jgi:hypothetical protein